MGHLEADYGGEMSAIALDTNSLATTSGTSPMQVKKRRMTLPTLDTVPSDPQGLTATGTPETPVTLNAWPESAGTQLQHSSPEHLATHSAADLYAWPNHSNTFLLHHAQAASFQFQHTGHHPLPHPDLSSSSHSEATLQDAAQNYPPISQGSTTSSADSQDRPTPVSASAATFEAAGMAGVGSHGALSFAPGSDAPRPLPPRVGRVLSHRPANRGTRLAAKKPRSLSLAFDKALAAGPHSAQDFSNQSPGPITPAMFSPSFMEALHTPTGQESPMIFNFSSPAVESNGLVHSSDLGFSHMEALHSPAHPNAGFGAAMDGTMDPAALSLGSHGGMSMGMAFGGLQAPLRSRMNSLTAFPPAPLSPHTPLGDGGMTNNLMAMMNGMASYPPHNPAHSHHPAFHAHPLAAATELHHLPLGALGGGITAGFHPDDDEKRILIMTPKVAQKSYGSEKRFLCPPPTVLLLGKNWSLPSLPPGVNCSTKELLAATAPRLTVSIPNENPSPQTVAVEWVGAGLKPNPTDPNADTTITGRNVFKNLYINEADDKRKTVEVSVHVQTPQGETLGSFPSRSIKVISKPSKKRQSIKNFELCIHHGSTISLFNRLRSQTVSTKYLGASNSIAAGGPPPDWSQPASAAPPGENTCFVARTNNWDPFIIWVVDPLKVVGDHDNYPTHPVQPGYPPTPAIAVSGPPSRADFNHPDVARDPRGQTLIPIHYNQTVVLQCLSTGMVSPVMIIRKVEKGSIATGGAYSPHDTGREVTGDPVSQLHKVAFEIRPTLKPNEPLPPLPLYPNGDVGNYLACLSDVVGTQASNGGKKPSSPVGGAAPRVGDGDMSPTTPHHPHMSHPHHPMMDPATAMAYGLPPFSPHPMMAPATPTGGKPSKGQKRGSVSRGSGHAEQSALASAWVEDATDAAVWTIVGTEFAQYTLKPGTKGATAGGDSNSFASANGHPYDQVSSHGHHHPHQGFSADLHAIGGGDQQAQHQASILATDPSGLNHGLGFPPPQHQHPVTYQQQQHQHHHHHSSHQSMGEDSSSDPIHGISSPVIINQVAVGEATSTLSQLGADPAAAVEAREDGADVPRTLITIFGDNFQPGMTVWFGNRCSPHTELKNRQVLLCLAPAIGDRELGEHLRGTALPIVLRAGNVGSADEFNAYSTGQQFTL
ncbi:hypothetical protein IWQ60_005704 [Tieghemiomyces parasiticus]|uniref:LAG1-DNAbind-domain-containing protein n=1 Tax=Tieghemiomyces parasiticus TaxID=78921 RepID=A0A9W8DY02_9FUNG|nr:hypothetical protein IWQ60_005704 [Tieghemiomyces parasiticus]